MTKPEVCKRMITPSCKAYKQFVEKSDEILTQNEDSSYNVQLICNSRVNNEDYKKMIYKAIQRDLNFTEDRSLAVDFMRNKCYTLCQKCNRVIMMSTFRNKYQYTDYCFNKDNNNRKIIICSECL